MSTKTQQQGEAATPGGSPAAGKPGARQIPIDPFRDNPLLSRGIPVDRRQRRKLLVASIFIHLATLVGVIFGPAQFFGKAEPEEVEIVFYTPAEAEEAFTPPKPKPEPEPEPIPEPEPEPEPILEEPKPEPVVEPEPETVIAELPPEPEPIPEPEPVREVRTELFREEPIQATPEPPQPRRQVRTALSSAPVEQPEPERPRRQVRTAMADTAPAERPEQPRRTRQASVGAFGAEEVQEAPKPRVESRVVAAGSFGASDIKVPKRQDGPKRSVATGALGDGEREQTSPKPTKRRNVKVAQAGFSAEPAERPAPTRRRQGTVAQTGFTGEESSPVTAAPRRGNVQTGGLGDGERKPRTRSRRKLPGEDLDSGVEVLEKPSPVYTEKARELRVEGEVVLNVIFNADGTLKILGVKQGLGHGLDEAAIAAASKMKFKPARRDGKPVDYTATLRVVFRLA